MKHFYTKLITLTLSAAGFVFGFSQYSNGYIVANEGNFGTPNAEISYIDESNVITNNVYATANGGAPLGDVLQNIYFHEDKAFLVLNNSNKITVVNRSSFVKTAEITDHIYQPRYTTIANGKLYTTNSPYGGNGTVTVHDASTNAFIKEIPLSQLGEQILTVNGKVYVMKSYFGAGDSIDVIDPASDTVVKTIAVGDALQGMVTNGTDIFAFCSTSVSSVFKIDPATDTVVKSVAGTGSSATYAFKFVLDGPSLYVGAGTGIYTISTALDSFPASPAFSVPAGQGWDELYALSAIDGKIFQGNANGFTASSTVNVYNPTGTLLNSFTATTGANAVYKNVYSTLSVANAANAKVTVYPNPVSDVLFIKGVQQASYAIFTGSGQKLKSGVYSKGITVSGLAKGLYILQITENGKTTTEKFIVK